MPLTYRRGAAGLESCAMTGCSSSRFFTARNSTSGVSRSEQRRFFVEPAVFTTLKRGGPLHNYQVEAIVYNGGNVFGSGAEALPYKLITFNQR